MDSKRKRTSDDDGGRVQKKIKRPIVSEDANGTSSSAEMTDCEIMSPTMPNGWPANCTENPEQNHRVHRVRTGQSVQGEFSGNRTEITMWDSNETAPTTTVNIISSDDEMNDGDTTCFENPIGLIESNSISQQQQQIFTHLVFDNHNLNAIDLTSEDDVINSHYSSPATISEESINSIPVRVSVDEQQQRLFTMSDNHNLDVIDLTSEDDVINSNYSIENYDDIDESETISEESVNSIPLRISIDEQQQLSLLDSNNLDVIDLTSEDNGDTNLYYSSQHVVDT